MKLGRRSTIKTGAVLPPEAAITVFEKTGNPTDLPSWDDIVRDHAGKVYGLAYHLTGNRYDAEDLTQETFIRVFRNLDKYQPGTFDGWLHRITTNLFLDNARRRARIRMEALPEDAESVPGSAPDPAHIIANSELESDVKDALVQLPPEYRVAVVLCDMEGLSYEEIANVLGVKMGTVRSRIHRGRTALREALEARKPRVELSSAE